MYICQDGETIHKTVATSPGKPDLLCIDGVDVAHQPMDSSFKLVAARTALRQAERRKQTEPRGLSDSRFLCRCAASE